MDLSTTDCQGGSFHAHMAGNYHCHLPYVTPFFISPRRLPPTPYLALYPTVPRSSLYPLPPTSRYPLPHFIPLSHLTLYQVTNPLPHFILLPSSLYPLPHVTPFSLTPLLHFNPRLTCGGSKPAGRRRRRGSSGVPHQVTHPPVVLTYPHVVMT